MATAISDLPDVPRLLLPPAADGHARFTREAYHRMADVLNSGPRVELIDGEIFMMSPIGPTQSMLVTRLSYFFTRNLPPNLGVAFNSPLPLAMTRSRSRT